MLRPLPGLARRRRLERQRSGVFPFKRWGPVVSCKMGTSKGAFLRLGWSLAAWLCRANSCRGDRTTDGSLGVIKAGWWLQRRALLKLQVPPRRGLIKPEPRHFPSCSGVGPDWGFVSFLDREKKGSCVVLPTTLTLRSQTAVGRSHRPAAALARCHRRDGKLLGAQGPANLCY